MPFRSPAFKTHAPPSPRILFLLFQQLPMKSRQPLTWWLPGGTASPQALVNGESRITVIWESDGSQLSPRKSLWGQPVILGLKERVQFLKIWMARTKQDSRNQNENSFLDIEALGDGDSNTSRSKWKQEINTGTYIDLH